MVDALVQPDAQQALRLCVGRMLGPEGEHAAERTLAGGNDEKIEAGDQRRNVVVLDIAIFYLAAAGEEILHQLGMLERFLKRPHNRVDAAKLRVAGREWTIGDLSHLDTPAPFIAMMPQWDFLDFLREEAKGFPGFQ